MKIAGWSQEFDDPLNVTCIPGAATTAKSKILVVSRNDPGVTPVVVVAAGQTFNSGTHFSMSPVNTDGAATVAWSGLVTVTGLDPFTRYSWTVTQGSDSDSGSFMTTPEPGSDFILPVASCDSTAYSPVWSREKSQTGIYPLYKRLAEKADPPVPGIFWIDDYGYVDTAAVDDSAGNTGLATTATPQTLDAGNEEYNYALGWIAFFGMCGGDEVDPNVGTAGLTLWGRAKERAWCRKNLNLYFQWGDHEFINDFGWDSDKKTGMNAGDPLPTAMCSSGIGVQDGAGFLVFERLFGLLRPDPDDAIPTYSASIMRDSVAKHWCAKMGDVLLVAPDFLTRCQGNYVGTIIPTGTTATTVYGNNQIDDMLDMVDAVRAPFTFFGMANGLRYPQNNGGTSDYPIGFMQEWLNGTQHPLYDYKRTEFDRFISASGNTPKSIMDNPFTNGAYGTTLFFHGDYHRAHAYRLARPASTGVLDEVLYSINVGTVNGSINFAATTEGEPGNSNNWVGVEVVGKDLDGTDNRSQWGLYAHVKGSAQPKQVEVHLTREDYVDFWTKNFAQYMGNYGYENIDPPGKGLSTGGGL